MFTLISTLGLSELASRELPALTAALVLAELFFKFHSFTLECLAFLGTWYVISWALGRLRGGRDRQERGA